MIFNIDFHSADMVAVVMGFMVLYAGIVAILTEIDYCTENVTENGVNSNTGKLCDKIFPAEHYKKHTR